MGPGFQNPLPQPTIGCVILGIAVPVQIKLHPAGVEWQLQDLVAECTVDDSGNAGWNGGDQFSLARNPAGREILLAP